MSKFLTPETVAARPGAVSFSPQKLEMLRRIFESVCGHENNLNDVQRQELAANLLEAARLTEDEETLVAVLKYDIAGFR